MTALLPKRTTDGEAHREPSVDLYHKDYSTASPKAETGSTWIRLTSHEKKAALMHENPQSTEMGREHIAIEAEQLSQTAENMRTFICRRSARRELANVKHQCPPRWVPGNNPGNRMTLRFQAIWSEVSFK